MVSDDRAARPPAGAPRRASRATVGLVMAVAGLALVLFAAAMLVWALNRPDKPTYVAPTAPPVQQPLGIAAVAYPTARPTQALAEARPAVVWERPTAEPEVVAAALSVPGVEAPKSAAILRASDPLTIIPFRSRNSVITYSVKKGDNLGSIAERFGIAENTIIWSNDRFYVNAMRVGLELNILPVNGVYHHVDQPQTIATIAEMYEVGPYDIIDSEYNPFFGATPDTILPEGLYVVVPGGTGSTEPIYWDPGITMTSAAGALTSAHGYASFGAADDPGSCGRQPVYNASLPVGAPIWRSYRITQDFSWNHGGIDLAVPAGTPIFAAGGGTVIFSGWSSWGYGYTVVLAHGGSLTVYGHLNGSFVACGEVVEAGQNIAVSGNSGNSSGPHLHFEIRGPDGRPTSPWNYQKF